MPYIDTDTRAELDKNLDRLSYQLNEYPLGVLTYVLTVLVYRYMHNTPIGLTADYERRSRVWHSLDDSKMAIYETEIKPYEEGKRRENGDVY